MKRHINQNINKGSWYHNIKRCHVYVFAFWAIIAPSVVFAQGLTIPASSTVNVNAGTLNVAGALDNNGTLTTTTGTISASGNVDNDGAATYTANSGTFILSGASGTQTISMGGDALFNLTHSGLGIAQIVNAGLNIDGTFTNSAGTFDANDLNMNVAGNWSHSATAIFDPGTGTVVLDGTNQSILGATNSFYNLTKIGANTLLFAANEAQDVTGTLTLQGVANSAGNRLVLDRSGGAGADRFTINLADDGLQNLDFLDVSNAEATNLDLIAVASVDTANNDSGEGSPEWVFGAATITWQGDDDDDPTDWDVPQNWNLGLVPTSADSVVIPDVTGSGGSQPILNVATVTVAALTMQVGATFDLDGNDLVVTNTLALGNSTTLTLDGGDLTAATLSSTGNIVQIGTETVTLTNIDLDSGTFTFIGDGAPASNFDFPELGATNVDYFNLVINATSALDNFRINTTNLDVNGSLTVTNGTLIVSTDGLDLNVVGDATVNGGQLQMTNGATSGSLDIDDDLVISSGVFIAPDLSESFTLAGDFTHSGGTFTHSSGTLNLNGTNQTVSATDTVFYNFTKAVTAAATLTFDHTIASADTPIITNMLTMTGTSTATLSINSTLAGTAAYLTLQAGGTQDLQYLSVQDSNASNGLLLLGRNSSETSGPGTSNNTNWDFDGTVITWQGDDGTTPTNWFTAQNWDLGIVPTDSDTAVIDGVPGSQPTLTANAHVENLTLQANAILTLAGFNLVVDSTLSNLGTIRLRGNETTVTITNIDADTGTFEYVGTGAGVTHTLKDFGAAAANDYFNLVINDAGASADNFVVGAGNTLTIAGALNVTDGTLNLSTNTNTMPVAGVLTVDGGTLTATDGNIDANGSVVISSGVLTAPDSGGSFTIADDFTHSGGTFTHSSGEVTFDTTTGAAIDGISGTTTFFDFTSQVPTKTITFTTAETITINGTFDVEGDAVSDLNITSSVVSANPADRFSLAFPNGAQTVQFLNVQGGEALNNNISCFNCVDAGNTDEGDAAPHWIFQTLSIDAPEDGSTTDTTPTIIGTGLPNIALTIKQNTCAGAIVASTTTDDNGNYRVEVDSGSPLAVGGYTLIPCQGVNSGSSVNITTVNSPNSNQQPTITSPVDGSRVHGATPTIEGAGLTGQTVTVAILDSDGDLVLNAGSGTVVAGVYSVTLTTALSSGVNYLSVTVNGVASDIFTIYLTDPFGVVFDSITSNPIENATVSIYRNSDNQLAELSVCDINGNITTLNDLACDDVNPYTTGADGFYSFLTNSADYYIVVAADSYIYPSTKSSFPSGRTIVTGSKGEVFTVSGTIIEMDHPVDPDPNLIRIEKDVNKTEAKIGEIVTYTITIENLSATTVAGVYIEDNIPPGFKYVDNRVTLDNVPINNPTGNRPLTFNIGDIPAGTIKTLRYQLVIGSGVSVGNYENRAFAKFFDGTSISNQATEAVRVVIDPLFDAGSVIGKVFFDRNENGIQDAPEYVHLDRQTYMEEPVPNVKIVMEDGTIITTDKNGMFSVPAVRPGRHLLRLDERTLPEGSYLTTDKVVIVDMKPGLLNKVNFGVNMMAPVAGDSDQAFFLNKVNVSFDESQPVPRLNASHFKNEMVIYNDIFVDNIEFRIFTNYAAFIEFWKLEIIDVDINKVIRSFSGNRFNIYDPIIWDGKDNAGNYIPTNRKYAYRLVVEDGKNNFDETKETPLVFKLIETQEAYEDYIEEREESKEVRLEEYKQWLEQQNLVDNKGIQTIYIQGERVIIDPINARLRNIRIMKEGQLVTEVPVPERRGLTRQELLDGQFVEDENKRKMYEVLLPNGQYDVLLQEDNDQIAALIPDGYKNIQKVDAIRKDVGLAPIQTYVKPIEVGKDRVFFVALGDATMGYAVNQGNIEPLAAADKYRDGFWIDGKLAYYIKGKVLGKYLVTSSFDSERVQKELFKNLDQDEYYPVYGDESSVNYEATNTQGPLYLLVEWDKSKALWGNYSVNFEDTEFARFSRSLYGGNIDFQSLGNTKYGDAKTEAVVFYAQSQYKSAHNEFLATGGSLYFLKHKDIIEGSDKVRIEIRDSITGLVLSGRDMVEGADYEIDYSTGRIIFWRPVPVLVEGYNIISNSLLEGNPVYVVTDYEYSVKDAIDESNVGGRFRQAISDQVLVGGTYVKESQVAGDYTLEGADITLRAGPDATVVAEVAQTQSEVQGNFVSTDGGLSFSELAVNTGSEGTAYGIKGDARLFNRLGFTSYYKWVENDFSTSSTTAQQGKEVSGLGITYDLGDSTRLTARYDIQELIDDGNLQTQAQVGATKTAATMLQLVHEARKLRLTAEYQRNVVTDKKEEFISETNTATDSVALRADYDLTDNVTVSLTQQKTLTGEPNDKTTVGVTAQANEKLQLDASTTFSQSGTSTTVGATTQPVEQVKLSAAQTFGAAGTESAFGVETDMGENINLITGYKITTDALGQVSTTSDLGLGTTVDVNDTSKLSTTVGVSNNSLSGQAATLSVGGSSQMDETTQATTNITVTDTPASGQTSTYAFGTTKKLTEDLQLVSARTFGLSDSTYTTGNTYSLIKTADGKEIKGTFTRDVSDAEASVSRSNIFGLSGDVNDKWALEGSLQRGDVQNLDGTQTNRNVVSVGAGYVEKDDETGEHILESSTKLEVRYDEGDIDRRQYLVYNAIEGRISPEITLFTKVEFSKTRNISQDFTEADHAEMSFGGAYRPIEFDRLNLLARYTYKQSNAPEGQIDSAGIEDERAHVVAADAIYDINEHWRLTEKYAMRIADEKVQGFDFTKTHTWLMIHRLDYKFDENWALGGEYRVLTQVEAQDAKSGVLVEATRRLGEYAQLGFGYNFTSFNDDLTSLNYTAQGPFVRMTGKFYDQTPEEIERAKQKWLDERIARWAWRMVQDELSRSDSPVLNELNEYFHMADAAYRAGDLEKSHQIYKDIIVAGNMMFEEASEHIRSRVGREKELKEMNKLADEYIKTKQYDKAKKILEKLLEESEKTMLECCQ